MMWILMKPVAGQNAQLLEEVVGHIGSLFKNTAKQMHRFDGAQRLISQRFSICWCLLLPYQRFGADAGGYNG